MFNDTIRFNDSTSGRFNDEVEETGQNAHKRLREEPIVNSPVPTKKLVLFLQVPPWGFRSGFILFQGECVSFCSRVFVYCYWFVIFVCFEIIIFVHNLKKKTIYRYRIHLSHINITYKHSELQECQNFVRIRALELKSESVFFKNQDQDWRHHTGVRVGLFPTTLYAN